MTIKEIDAKKFNLDYTAGGKNFILAENAFMDRKTSHHANNFLAVGPSDERQVLIIANILHADCNLVINDTTGELYKYTNEKLKKKGYKIYRLSFGDCTETDVIHYNPLGHSFLYEQRSEISGALTNKYDKENNFWNIAMKSLFMACFEYLDGTMAEYTFNNVYQLLDSLKTTDNFLDSPVCKYPSFKTVLLLPTETIRNTIARCMQIIQTATIPSVKEAIKHNDIDMSIFCDGKIALFIDKPQSYDLINIIRDQFFLDIINGLAKVDFYSCHIMFVLDDIQNIDLNRFVMPVTCIRSQNMSFWIGISDINQLSDKVGEISKPFMNVCNLIFLDRLNADINNGLIN